MTIIVRPMFMMKMVLNAVEFANYRPDIRYPWVISGEV